MSPKVQDVQEHIADLLEKLLIVELHLAGATQEKISRAVGRRRAWVNEFLKGVPKGGNANE